MGGERVSLEKSLLASPLQLQASCHDNKVRGPPRQQLTLRLQGGVRPEVQTCSPVCCDPRAPEVTPYSLGYCCPQLGPQPLRCSCS